MNEHLKAQQFPRVQLFEALMRERLVDFRLRETNCLLTGEFDCFKSCLYPGVCLSSLFSHTRKNNPPESVCVRDSECMFVFLVTLTTCLLFVSCLLQNNKGEVVLQM